MKCVPMPAAFVLPDDCPMTPSIPSIARRRPSPAGQRGVATLIVVMVLFFVLSMVAAYTSKNIVFEQRISSNLFQATVSTEAAEAGMEWALGMLNGSLIDDQCQPIEDLSGPSRTVVGTEMTPDVGSITR
jgi:Tfp pilus assembly protein PilX